MAGEEMHPSGRRVGRRLLGGGMDLAAAENQVYLFMVIFGTILGATFSLIGHYKIKPLFLAMPELLYFDSEGSKYRVTICT